MITVTLPLEKCQDEEFIKLIKGCGFDGVDMGFFHPIMENDSCIEMIYKIKDLFEKYDIYCEQAHLPFYNMFESSEVYNKVKDSAIINSLKAMGIMGIKWGAYHTQSSSNYNYDRKRAMRDNIEALKRYADIAEKYNTGIAVENLPIFPDCPQYRFFTYDEEDHIELVDSINSKRIGVCWDFGHANLMKYDMPQVLEKVGNRIKIVHIHDNNKMCDMHVCPGIGAVDWESAMGVLKSCKCTFPVNLEVKLDIIHTKILEDYIKMCSKMARYIEGLML